MVRPRIVATAAAAALLLCACGDEGEGTGGGRAEEIEGVTLSFGHPQPVEGGEAVRVVVGARPCELPARAAIVRETAEVVRIRLVGQELPPDAVCAEVLASECFEVPLDRPLGGRRVEDASGREAFLDDAMARRARQGDCPRVERRD